MMALVNQPAMLAFAAAITVSVVFAAIVFAGTAASKGRSRRMRLEAYVHRMNQKGDTVRDRRNDARRKLISTKMKSLQEGKRHGKSRIGAVRGQLARAGITTTLTQFWGMCMGAGLLCSAAWFLFGSNPALAPLVFAFTTFGIPQIVLRRMAKKRQKEFTKYFSTAIDVIVRGLKAGLPVQECFRIIGREIPDPCGNEFRTIINEVNAGLNLQEALERSYQRMPTQELRFFTTVVAVQSQTGGNLAEILGNISSVLRGRAALKEKIKALSSEARMSSLIVGCMPFFVAGVLTMVNYAYISLLWTTHTGEIILFSASCLMALGMFVMNRMGTIDI
jgi:tight adherence protein B